MRVETRVFGTIEIPEEKIITMEKGMIGFPDLKQFTLIYDEEKGSSSAIKWLQSLDEPEIAFPVMVPNDVKPDYNPTVEDEYLTRLGELTDDNIYLLVTVTVPKQIEKLSVNLKAPIIINSDNNKGAQIIAEDNFPVKFMIYDFVKGSKENSVQTEASTADKSADTTEKEGE